MRERETEIPKGWEYNPSTCRQRLPIIILALIAALITAYLGLFQLKLIEDVWDPFFDSRKISPQPFWARPQATLPMPWPA